MALLILLNEQRRDGVRCDQDCYGAYRTYEAGHPWTNYPDAWQWDAQNILMTVAFLVALAGSVFLIAHNRRRAVILTIASIVMSAIFIVWVQVSPPVGSELDPHRAVVLDRPVRVVGDLPRVAVGVDEDA